MHGQNINLPLCVCVYLCVRHTFCLIAYRSDPSTDFYSCYSLKDADLRKDVPFGVSMMNNHIYGSKVPQNPHFGGLNRHFKPNMRKIQIAVYLDLCIRLT